MFFYDLNIILNLSHPSNHSITSTSFTLNPLTFTFNPLKVNKTSLHSNPLESILSLSLQSMMREREGKEDGNSSIFQSCLLYNGLRAVVEPRRSGREPLPLPTFLTFFLWFMYLIHSYCLIFITSS